jgi:hypothetical protein
MGGIGLEEEECIEASRWCAE